MSSLFFFSCINNEIKAKKNVRESLNPCKIILYFLRTVLQGRFHVQSLETEQEVRGISVLVVTRPFVPIGRFPFASRCHNHSKFWISFTFCLGDNGHRTKRGTISPAQKQRGNLSEGITLPYSLQNKSKKKKDLHFIAPHYPHLLGSVIVKNSATHSNKS